MTPEQILAFPARVLSREQREFYFREGYLLLPGAISVDRLHRLREASDELVERSRRVSRSDAVFDLEPGHSAQAPRLRRVSSPVDQHPAFWEYCTHSPQAAAQAKGGDVTVQPSSGTVERILEEG